MGGKKHTYGDGYSSVKGFHGTTYKAPDWQTLMRPQQQHQVYYELVLSAHYDGTHTYIVCEHKSRKQKRYHMYYYLHGRYPKNPTRTGEFRLCEHEYCYTDDFNEFKSWVQTIVTLYTESDFLTRNDSRKQWFSMDRIQLEDK